MFMRSDISKISEYYKILPAKVSHIRNTLGRPLSLTEKILFSHLVNDKISCFARGVDYVDFFPDRVAMQDATAQMALLQFLVTEKESTAVPASVHCDHLIMAKYGAEKDLESALESNKEVYDFLRSVCENHKIDFWKPGSGIIHQVIFENYAYPGGLMIGTDSHTPTAGGMGMIAIGVGGADATEVMTGMSWELKLPKLIGIRLTGRLNGWASAKDVILRITGMLSVKGGTGSVIEYFGDGAESLSATGKATICNMGAETGATCSIFGFDKQIAVYLTATGRKGIADQAQSISRDLTGDPEVYDNPEKYFDNYLEINLSEIEPHINGPFSPDFATPLSKMKEECEKHGWPADVSAGLIGSCTNSSYEDISRAASVIKNALKQNLPSKAEIKINPGSELIRRIAERDGYLELFRKIGAEIFANACGPCIGQWDRKDADKQQVNTVIHSFNRNFARRTDGNPNTHAFVASPEMVAAIAIAGKLTFNPLTDTLINKDGKPVMIAEPSGDLMPPEGFGITEGSEIIKGSGRKKKIKINPRSERLQILTPFTKWNGKDFTDMRLLIKVKGKCTTDHISMAGKWLKYRGHLENISHNYMIGAINFFNDQANKVLNQITREYSPVPDVAFAYKRKGIASVVIGEENFGEGSSREHAAMEPRFLNVKAIIVKSFARIHETNLKKQGILTLTFSDRDDYLLIREDDRISITGLKDFVPGRKMTVTLNHSDGTIDKFLADHSYNEAQIEWFRAGSALNLMRKRI
jgi:aconitate hydratase